MNSSIKTVIGGTEVVLLGEKALYWPAGKTACVADVHFGKAAAYRALHQPVPTGTTAANLASLDRILESYDVERLVFLGDFFHAPSSISPPVIEALSAWRRRNRRLDCILVRGNHDRRAGDPPLELEVTVTNEPSLLGPFALRHTPGSHATHYVLAGHVHPTIRLRGKGKERFLLPCFQVDDGMTVLPAFGEFTGGHPVRRTAKSRFFITDGSHIWSAPSAGQ